MPTSEIKNQLKLHFIVFIWGFTAILGALIEIDALPLVWYRVVLASVTLALFFLVKKIDFKVSGDALMRFVAGGVLIALHWLTFFYAIKVSTVSTTLISMSSSAIFVALLEPILGQKKFRLYELLLASLALIGFIIIFYTEKTYKTGILYALLSSLLLAFFSIFNMRNIQKYRAVHIAFYELFFAAVFLTIVIYFTTSFSVRSMQLTASDWVYISILATVCTAYPFVAATNLLHKLGTYTLVLTNNLEPVYGIILAVLIFGDKEKMNLPFYLGAAIIFFSVLANAYFKYKKN